MTSTQQSDEMPDETPGGSTISDPEVFNDPAGDDADTHGEDPDGDADPDAARNRIGTTRGGQPIESNRRSPADIAQADRAHEEEVSAGFEQIGVTRGNQPIEKAVGGI